nr:hypothetical protein [Tanacetum cinerariifolium]
MEDTIAQTRSKRVSKQSNDSLLAREKTKTSQELEINSLKRRVKKLEKKQRSKTHKLKRLYKVGLYVRVESSDDNVDLGEDASKQGRKINDIDADEDITLVNDAGEITAASIVTTDSVAATMTDKGKGIIIEKPVKLKKKDQILLDEEVAKKLQAEINEKQRLAGEIAQQELKANIALIET